MQEGVQCIPQCKIDLSVSLVEKLDNFLSGSYYIHCSLFLVLCLPCPEICNLCTREGLIFPCIEAFQAGIKFPSVHMVFYEYFLKSCVGDSEWKDICLNPTNCQSDAFVDPPLEAFATIMLENNYFSWLLSAKDEYGDTLVTDYDTADRRENKIYFAQYHVNGVELDLVDVPPGETFVPTCDAVMKLMVYPESGNPEKFDILKRQREDELDDICVKAMTNNKYREMMSELKQMQHEDQESTESQPEAGIAEMTNDTLEKPVMTNDTTLEKQSEKQLEKKRKEKRNTLKKLRKYTNVNDTDAFYKGWSKEMPHIQLRIMKSITENEEKYKQFRSVYRLNFKMRTEKSSAKKRKPVQEAPPINYDELFVRSIVTRRAEI